MSATLSNVQEAFNVLQDLHNVVNGTQPLFPPFTTGAVATSGEESAAKNVLATELDYMVETFKGSVLTVMQSMTDEELDKLNVQTMSGLFKNEFKTSIKQLAKK